MKSIPKSVKIHAANARYYFRAAMYIPAPVTQAARILLLLTSREHINLAIAELRKHQYGTALPDNIYKDHLKKLEEVRGPVIQLTPFGDDKVFIEKAHLSPEELKLLLETSRFGPKGALVDLESHFGTLWHTEEFERDLRDSIEKIERRLQIAEDFRNPKPRIA